MYALDPTAAKKADQTGSRINEIGKYVGKFTQAEDIVARTGTKGIAMRFEANGQSANLPIYVQKSNGDQIMGFQTLMAVMTCLGLRNITPKPGIVTQWDNDARKEVEREAQVFPDLCGKEIGLLLETEDYTKQDGSTGTRMVIAGIFQAKTDLTASEILDRKTTPEVLPKLVARLRHRPIKGGAAPRPAAPMPAHAGSAPSAFDDLDDSIPFVTASAWYDMTTSKSRKLARYDY